MVSHQPPNGNFGDDAGASDRPPNRRRFLRFGGLGLAGAAITVFAFPAGASAKRRNPTTSIMKEVDSAAEEYDVPASLLLAMGYVNTRLEMPAPSASAYAKGDPEGRGTYGVMALERNPSTDTLGKASSLTGLPARRLKTDRAANIRGGAALLAHAQGRRKPADPHQWLGAASGPGDQKRRATSLATGARADPYSEQLADTLRRGFSVRTASGERVSLQGKGGSR